MKPESRPSSEQGLASAVNLAGAFDHEFTQTPWPKHAPLANRTCAYSRRWFDCGSASVAVAPSNRSTPGALPIGQESGDGHALMPETTCAAHRIFSLTPNRARHPLGVPLRTLTKGVSSAPAIRTFTGDWEKSPAAGR